MLQRTRPMIFSTSAPSGEMAPNLTSWSSVSLSFLNLRMVSAVPSIDSGGAMTLTREPSGRRASQIGLEFVDAAADLADDALADVEQLLVVAEADAGLLDLAVDFDVDLLGAVDHDVGDVVAGQQRLQRAVAEHVVADVLEQFLLLGDRHREILDRDDVVDDVADFLARALRLELGELRQVDRVDQRREDLALGVVVGFAALALQLACGSARGGASTALRPAVAAGGGRGRRTRFGRPRVLRNLLGRPADRRRRRDRRTEFRRRAGRRRHCLSYRT